MKISLGSSLPGGKQALICLLKHSLRSGLQKCTFST